MIAKWIRVHLLVCLLSFSIAAPACVPPERDAAERTAALAAVSPADFGITSRADPTIDGVKQEMEQARADVGAAPRRAASRPCGTERGLVPCHRFRARATAAACPHEGGR